MKNICAGIVLYNPSIKQLEKNINAIFEQVEAVLLVDNNSDNINEINRIIKKYPNCHIIENKKNLGIAKALNQLCSKAYKDHYEWILTLDQDTICPNNLIEEMSKYTGRKDVGIICPAVHYSGLKNKKNRKDQDSEPETTVVKACMTSASLTRLDVWKEVKGFRNDYFIDFVDNEYCLKIKIKGYKVLRVNKCCISHQLGYTGVISFLGKKIKFTRHKPIRYYYMIRNNRVFIKEYSAYLPVIKELIKLWYILICGLLFSDRKAETLHYIILGYKHGISHRMGALED